MALAPWSLSCTGPFLSLSGQHSGSQVSFHKGKYSPGVCSWPGCHDRSQQGNTLLRVWLRIRNRARELVGAGHQRQVSSIMLLAVPSAQRGCLALARLSPGSRRAPHPTPLPPAACQRLHIKDGAVQLPFHPLGALVTRQWEGGQMQASLSFRAVKGDGFSGLRYKQLGRGKGGGWTVYKKALGFALGSFWFL